MNDSKVPVRLGVWQRFNSNGLEIVPSLAGANLQFEQDGLTVAIRLPKRPKAKDWHDWDGPITCSSYHYRGTRKNPNRFSVHSVDVELDLGKERALRSELPNGPVNVSKFWKAESTALDKDAAMAMRSIIPAYQRWIEILRWKSGIPTICQEVMTRQTISWGTYLLDLSTRERFYAPPFVFKIESTPPVTMRAWNATAEALRNKCEVPMWHLYYAEAIQKLRLGDTRGFVIDLAIACEAVIRQATKQLLPDPTPKAFQEMVNFIQIGNFLKNWKDIGFNSKAWQALAKEQGLVKNITDMRNRIMHRGEVPKIDEARADKLANAARLFIMEAEKKLSR